MLQQADLQLPIVVPSSVVGLACLFLPCQIPLIPTVCLLTIYVKSVFELFTDLNSRYCDQTLCPNRKNGTFPKAQGSTNILHIQISLQNLEPIQFTKQIE